MTHETPYATTTATASSTIDAPHPINPRIVMGTGFTGRPPRNRYSKAYMMADIVSLLDPRLWPVYVGGALIVAIPCFALMGAASTVLNQTVTAKAAVDPDAPWQTPEEGMANADPRSAASTAPSEIAKAPKATTTKKQVAIFAPLSPAAHDTRSAPASPSAAQNK